MKKSWVFVVLGGFILLQSSLALGEPSVKKDVVAPTLTEVGKVPPLSSVKERDLSKQVGPSSLAGTTKPASVIRSVSGGFSLEETFSGQETKQVLLHFSGKLTLKKSSQAKEIAIVVKSPREEDLNDKNLKCFQTRNKKKVVLESEKGNLSVEVSLPHGVQVFLSSGEVALHCDHVENDVTVQAGVLNCEGALSGALRAVAGEAKIRLAQLKKGCHLSYGKGDVVLCYDKPEKGVKGSKCAKVFLTQGSGKTCVQVPKTCRVKYYKKRVQSSLSCEKDPDIQTFFYGNGVCTVESSK